MKVIQILPELNSGGVERGTLEVARFLVQQGHQSLVVSNGGQLVANLEADGSRHITRPVHRKSPWSLRQVPALRRLFRTEAPDIVHIRSRLPGWLAWLAWRSMDPATRPHLVSTVHGLSSVNAYSRIMTRGERVIAISKTCRDYILEHHPKTDPDIIRVIPRGIDPACYPHGFQASPDWLTRWQSEHPDLAGQFVITLPGRLSERKGQADLIRMVALLRQDGIPSHALLVGSTHPRKRAYHQALLDLATSVGVAPHLTILSHRDDVREIMSVSDVVVSLSHLPEAFGRVSLEALALGKPVAGYAEGGVLEQLDYFFPDGAIPPHEVEAGATLLASWYRHGIPSPPERRDHPFTLDAMLRSTIAVYEELLS